MAPSQKAERCSAVAGLDGESHSVCPSELKQLHPCAAGNPGTFSPAPLLPSRCASSQPWTPPGRERGCQGSSRLCGLVWEWFDLGGCQICRERRR